MKWKKKIWVIDDIVPAEHQERIKNTLLGPTFPWYFVPDITGGGSRDQRPGFSHGFIHKGEIKSHEENIKLLEVLWESCMRKIKEKTNTEGKYSVSKARTFLQLPLKGANKKKYDSHHIDLMDEHFALLYYVCDSDGDTVIFDNMYSRMNQRPPEPSELIVKKRVTPKQGRVVIFDGYYWHTATQPTKSIRCIINTDVLQHG
jgi:hypothetical protein